MTPKAFAQTYFVEFEDVYHTQPECPAGRLIPPELRHEGYTNGRALCEACRARELAVEESGSASSSGPS